MLKNKVVCHYVDGNIRKGSTRDFLPHKSNFHIEDLEGATTLIHVADLKAIFFVRDHVGSKDRQRSSDDEIAGGGRRTHVVFADGEELIGYVASYRPERPGFFLVPADIKGNNERIFVVAAACKSVEFVEA